MDWNKLAILLFIMALAAYFLWSWHDGGKTGVINIKWATVEREREPLGFEIVRWFCLVAGLAAGGLVLFLLLVQL